jgi:alanyl-tRNA synthetase
LAIVDTFYNGSWIVHSVIWPDDDGKQTIFEFLEDHRDVKLAVDARKRLSTMRNHTATHLLHAALRRVLGDHVAQAGSLVAPDRLRFDFHHFQAMRDEEITDVEKIVNDAVMSDYEVNKRQMTFKDAVAEGAVALFGEKYGDTVRVVSVADVSMELCGGTHLRRTGEVGAFYIRQESAVGAGIRRVEAVTGSGAIRYTRDILRERKSVAELLKVGPEDVVTRVRALLEETESLQKQLKKDATKRAKDEAADAMTRAEDVGGIKYVSIAVDAPDIGALRKYGDELRNKLGLGLAVVCQNKPEKPVVLIVASDSLIKERSVKATDLTKSIAEKLSFRGGGKPHMAQVGIPDLEAFDRIRDFVKEELANLG